MGTLLVTGGAGFIGSNVVRDILDNTEHSVTVLGKPAYTANRANWTVLILSAANWSGEISRTLSSWILWSAILARWCIYPRNRTMTILCAIRGLLFIPI